MTAKGWFLPVFFLVAVLCMVGMYYYVSTGSVEISNRHAMRAVEPKPLRSSPPNGYFASRKTRSVNAARETAVANPPTQNTKPETTSAQQTVSIPPANKPPTAIEAQAVAVVADDATTKICQPGGLVRRWQQVANNIQSAFDALAADLDREALRWRSNLGREPYLQTWIAWALFYDGEISAAELQIDRALKNWPQHEYALNSKIDMARATNRWRRVADGYIALADVRPHDPQPRYNAAVVFSRLGQFGAANLWFDRTLDVDPNHAKALYNLAAVAQYSGRLAEAEGLWTRLTNSHPNVISAWYQRGAIAFDLGNFPEAGFAFEQVVRIDPLEADALVNLGETHLVAGNLEAAYDALTGALKIDECHDAALASVIDVCDVLSAWFPADRDIFRREIATCRARLDAMGLAPAMYADASELDDDRGLGLQSDFGANEDTTVNDAFIFGAEEQAQDRGNVFAGSDADDGSANRAALE